jgi:D-aminopeptidase
MIARSLLAIVAAVVPLWAAAQEANPPIRARDLGIPFDGRPGEWNAITDVPGVTVGFSTIIGESESGAAIRTGVTAILPRGFESLQRKVYAAIFSLNGNGEMTGSHWIAESGFMEGPVMITNTHSIGVVHDAVIAWRVQHGPPDAEGYFWSLPVVAETADDYLNDMNGFHVQPGRSISRGRRTRWGCWCTPITEFARNCALPECP